MASIEDRLTWLEQQVAGLQNDQVTRFQFSTIGRQFDLAQEETADAISDINNQILSLTRRIASLGGGLNTIDSYVHTQGTATTTWTISHNLGYQYPQVLVVDTSDDLVTPTNINFLSDNTLTIDFTAAQAGIAVISRIG